jgi:hypothetical protein
MELMMLVRGAMGSRADGVDRGAGVGPVAIVGIGCRFPGARDPAELHDLGVAGHRRFQPAAGLPGRPLHAALLDDWTVPAVSFGGPELEPHDLGPRWPSRTPTCSIRSPPPGPD